MFPGTRYGRSSSGAVNRSRTTAIWAAANASRTPKLNSAARNATSSSAMAVTATSIANGNEDHGRNRGWSDQRAPAEQAERTRQHPVLAHRVRETSEAGDRGRSRGEQDESPREPDEDPQEIRRRRRQVGSDRVDDPEQRREQPLVAERGLTVLDRKRREADDRDRNVERDDDTDGGEEPAADVDTRPPSLFGEVRNRLEPRVGEHCERQRECDLVPARARAEIDPGCESVGRDEEGEAEDDEQPLRREVEHSDTDPGRVQARAPEEPNERDRNDHPDADDHVPRPIGERVDPERPTEIVREKERGKRDDDDVVEEEHPARAEACEVVERLAHERRGATGLGNGGDPFGV